LARCLIIGCGCRGLLVARELTGRGHAVRGTTRDRRRVEILAGAGVEPLLADPDRLATFGGALDHVSVVCVFLGSAAGDGEQVRALHGPRLQMLLSRMLDTTVRGVVYEAAGSVNEDVLRAGASLVEEVCSRSRIPFELLDANPADYELWAAGAVQAVGRLLNT
jgi:hypothetical protein